MLICPVFWEGELFCWVTNCLHQYDIGGITPSSFCPSAESVFDEGIMIPPIRIVENNEIRRDLEELYLRSSRKPNMVALDFRAQLAGNMTARNRILELIRRYGPEVVKGVMKRVVANGEVAFLKKLERLPDGVWQRPHLRRMLPARRPQDLPGDAHAAQAGRPAHLRERGHGAAGRRDERHLFGLARLDHGGAQSAAVLGPVLLARAGRCATSISIRRWARSTAPPIRPRCRRRRCRRWRFRSIRPTT